MSSDSEYLTRAQLKQLTDDANQRAETWLRLANNLKRIREETFAAARNGQYSWSCTSFSYEDICAMDMMMRRMLPGCTFTVNGNHLTIYWF